MAHILCSKVLQLVTNGLGQEGASLSGAVLASKQHPASPLLLFLASSLSDGAERGPAKIDLTALCSTRSMLFPSFLLQVIWPFHICSCLEGRDICAALRGICP